MMNMNLIILKLKELYCLNQNNNFDPEIEIDCYYCYEEVCNCFEYKLKKIISILCADCFNLYYKHRKKNLKIIKDIIKKYIPDFIKFNFYSTKWATYFTQLNTKKIINPINKNNLIKLNDCIFIYKINKRKAIKLISHEYRISRTGTCSEYMINLFKNFMKDYNLSLEQILFDDSILILDFNNHHFNYKDLISCPLYNKDNIEFIVNLVDHGRENNYEED